MDNSYHMTKRTNVPRIPCLNSCSESHVGKENKIGLKWTCEILLGFICLFGHEGSFFMYNCTVCSTNLSLSGWLEMVPRVELKSNFTIYKDLLPQNCLFFGPQEKGMHKKYPFNEWIVGIKPWLFQVQRESKCRLLEEAPHDKHIEANFLACPFSWNEI